MLTSLPRLFRFPQAVGRILQALQAYQSFGGKMLPHRTRTWPRRRTLPSRSTVVPLQNNLKLSHHHVYLEYRRPAVPVQRQRFPSPVAAYHHQARALNHSTRGDRPPRILFCRSCSNKVEHTARKFTGALAPKAKHSTVSPSIYVPPHGKLRQQPASILPLLVMLFVPTRLSVSRLPGKEATVTDVTCDRLSLGACLSRPGK